MTTQPVYDPLWTNDCEDDACWFTPSSSYRFCKKHFALVKAAPDLFKACDMVWHEMSCGGYGLLEGETEIAIQEAWKKASKGGLRPEQIKPLDAGNK